MTTGQVSSLYALSSNVHFYADLCSISGWLLTGQRLRLTAAEFAQQTCSSLGLHQIGLRVDLGFQSATQNVTGLIWMSGDMNH